MTVPTLAPDFTLRRATPKDANAISTLGTAIFTVSFGHSCTPEQLQNYLEEAYSEEAIATDLANPDKDTVVAVTEDTDEVVGFVMLTRGTTEPCIEQVSNCIELQRLYVDTKRHGRGLGGQLERAAEDLAREQGFENIWLGVWEENHKAQRVYEKLGFNLVGSHLFDVGGDIQTDLVMLKAL